VFLFARKNTNKPTQKNKGREKLFADNPLAALAAISRVIQHRPDLAALQCRNVECVTRIPDVLGNHYDGGRSRQQVAEFLFHATFIEPLTTQTRQDARTSLH